MEWKKAGLILPSVAKTVLATIEKRLVIKKLGSLQRADRESLEASLRAILYLVFRPHQGLRGATPVEAFLGCEPACIRAVSPARGKPGEETPTAPFAVAYLDPVGGRFPVLTAA